MSGSWDAMLEDEERIEREVERQSRLERRRQLARLSKVELIDRVLRAEATEHEIGGRAMSTCRSCGSDGTEVHLAECERPVLHCRDCGADHEIRRQS